MKGLITPCWGCGPLWHPSFPKQGGCQAGWLLIFNGKSISPRTWMHWVKHGIIFMLSQISFACPGLSQDHCVSKHLIHIGENIKKWDGFLWPLCRRFWECHGHCYWPEQNSHLFCACLHVSAFHWVLAHALSLWGWAHTHFPYNSNTRGSMFVSKHSRKNDSHICCRVELTIILFLVFK